VKGRSTNPGDDLVEEYLQRKNGDYQSGEGELTFPGLSSIMEWKHLIRMFIPEVDMTVCRELGNNGN
jgi:hypothetical protein